MTLTREQTKTFYDRFGRKQDTQAFYEDAALDVLVDHAAFEDAQSLFELGCGTGRFAARLLQDHLPASATYLGSDLSTTMIDIAGQRLAPFAERAKVMQSDGSMHFPLADHSVDRVISTYVLDLLPESDIRLALAEAHRVLTPNGKLCVMSLTHGETVPSKLLSGIWSKLFRLRPQWVGGCRPIRLAPFFGRHDWTIEYRTVISQFGVPSEVLIASPVGDGISYPDEEHA